MFAKINYLFRLSQSFSLTKIYNLIKLYASYYSSILSGKIKHKGEPWSLSIETGTFCNLSCLECPSGQKQFTRPTGYMSLESFKTIIDKQKKYLIWLILYFQGEPYLNKSFFQMVSYAKANNIFTTTSSNGHFLDTENAKKTVESGLDRIIISLDGLDQETYEKYRVGGNYNTVIDGIKNLVQAKKQLKSHHPYIVIQFIVFKTNEHQLSRVKGLKKELGIDKVEIKTAQIYSSNDDNELLPSQEKHRRYIQNKNGEWEIKTKAKNRCNRMWRAAVISWDGDVVPCCYDKDADYKMGNLLENSFKQIKNAEKYQKFRQQVFSDRSKIDICRNCPEQ